MLIAKYTVELTAPLHTAWIHTLHVRRTDGYGTTLTEQDVFSPTHRPTIDFTLDDYTIGLEFSIEHVENPLLSGHNWIGTKTLKITATNAAFDETSLSIDAFRNTERSYAEVIRRVINRLVSFCRFELGYPFLRYADATRVTQDGWFSESGAQLQIPNINSAVFARFPGAPGSLGSKYLTRPRLQQLATAMAEDQDPCIQDELLSQARDAIYEGHTLKSTLLLAITCEVAIKSKFFREDSLAATAFDYLEEKRQVEIATTELIDKVAKRAFGQSFKEHNIDANKDIEHLFRCRNKVAHRARAEFKDDRGTLHQVDTNLLHKWWQSVASLLAWLTTSRAVPA